MQAQLKPLNDLYARCNLSIIEHEKYEEVATNEAWKKPMNTEVEMIKKNQHENRLTGQ